jgi:serine-type D-Ala-D-Ala carboxypeptidase (penicillin-binding protein 5/6)
LDRIVGGSRLDSRSWRRARYVVRSLIVAAVLATGPIAAAAPSVAMVAPGPGVRESGVPARDGGLPLVDVRGADLADASTGAMLWSKNASVPRPMGSITKVMTALVVLQTGDLGQEIKVTRGAIRYVRRDGASSSGLIAGDVLTARQLLEAMMLPSGCDAAYLLATAYGPGRQTFVAKMNAMAQEIGLASTHFTSFDGMPFPTEHSTYSSPADLVRLGEVVMANPVFRRIVAQRSYHVATTPLHHQYLWYTTDHLLGSYRGAIGIKTGDTDAAGNCLLFAARRNGRTLIGVVQHVNPTSNFSALFTTARRLLNWGFRQT